MSFKLEEHDLSIEDVSKELATETALARRLSSTMSKNALQRVIQNICMFAISNPKDATSKSLEEHHLVRTLIEIIHLNFMLMAFGEKELQGSGKVDKNESDS